MHHSRFSIVRRTRHEAPVCLRLPLIAAAVVALLLGGCESGDGGPDLDAGDLSDLDGADGSDSAMDGETDGDADADVDAVDAELDAFDAETDSCDSADCDVIDDPPLDDGGEECEAIIDFSTTPPDPNVEAVDSNPGPDAPVLRLGVSRDAFMAADSGDAALIEWGIQGGFHVYGGVEISGLDAAPTVEQVYWITICSSCGDGLRVGDEACDPGRDVGCTDSCEDVCGNGVVDADTGETCDPGPTSNEDCDWDCTVPRCGDMAVNRAAGEECEPAPGGDAFCDIDCTRPACGDGVVNEEAGEICDPGGGDDVDPAACRTGCPTPVCGNGAVEDGEDCEPPSVGECSAACRLPYCGDGMVNGDEDCDAAGTTPTCDGDCTPVACGDGFVNALTERCDDGAGNGQPGRCNDTCSGTTAPSCGNDVVEWGEQCDGDSADCGSDCLYTTCNEEILAQIYVGERELNVVDGGYGSWGNNVAFASGLTPGDVEGRPITLHALVRTADCVFLYDSVDIVPTQNTSLFESR